MVALSKETSAVLCWTTILQSSKLPRRLLDSVGWKVEAFSGSDRIFRARRNSLSRACSDRHSGARHERTGGANASCVDVSPSTRVIVLTAKDDPAVRRIAMNAGASAFFIKGVESGEFLAGVKAAADSGN